MSSELSERVAELVGDSSVPDLLDALVEFIDESATDPGNLFDYNADCQQAAKLRDRLAAAIAQWRAEGLLPHG